MMNTLGEIFSKKAQRQRTLEIMRMHDEHLDPLYEWCLTKFDNDSHPFLPLALSLTFGRLLATFLLRQATPGTSSVKAKEGDTEADITKRQQQLSVNVEPSMACDPAVSLDDRNGTLLRIEKSNDKYPRLQLTSRVASNLDGLVNDLLQVLKIIKDPTEDTLAITTVLEKARAILPESENGKGDIFGQLLCASESTEKQVAEEKLFCIFARVTLGWTTEKLKRSVENYHDHVWLCDQMQVVGEDEPTRRITWKIAILFKMVAQNQDPHQTYPSRRYALLASCAAVGLWKCWQMVPSSRLLLDQQEKQGEETKMELESNEGDNNKAEGNPPKSKRPRVSSENPSDLAAMKVMEDLVEAARKEAAFTRWIGGGSSGRWKIAANLNNCEIRQATLSLARLLLVAVEEPLEEDEPDTRRVMDHVMWWQVLSKFLTKLPDSGQWESLADVLYDQLLQRDENAKTFSQNIQSFHEFAILEYEQNKIEGAKLDRPTIQLVDKVVWDVPYKADPRTAAIVSKGPAGEQAIQIERMIVKPSVEKIKKRALMPKVYSEGMELNEWAVALLSLEDVVPTPELIECLNRALPGNKEPWKELLPKIVNKSLLLLLQESMTAKVGRKASVSIDAEGVLTVSGEVTDDKVLCRGIVAFFYHSLESLLGQDNAPPTVDDTFMRAIMACCMTCVVPAAGITLKIHPKVKDSPVYSFMQMTESTPMSFLHYAPLFRSSLTDPNNASTFPLPKGLPRRVHRDFFNAEMHILDSVLWMKDPSFEDVLPDRVDDLIETTDNKCCWWPVKVLVDEKEDAVEDVRYPSAKEDTYYLEIYHNLSVLMERALEVSYNRMERVCGALGVAHWRLLLKHSWQTFRHLLRRHVKLFYDRHLDHWILTTIYGVGKRMKFDPEISFARTIEAYTSVRSAELGEAQCHRIVRQVKIKTSEGSSQLGHIILLYNKVFIPAMRSYLLKSESLKEATERLQELKTQNTPLHLPKIYNPSIPIKQEPDDDDDEDRPIVC